MARLGLSSNDTAVSHDETEEDIANNNDPNNNAFDMDPDENPDTLENTNETESEKEQNINDEISSILNLLPDSNREDIRMRLERHWLNPLRQQIGDTHHFFKL